MVFIMGATAVGKSNYAIEYAKRIGGEIISCDSLQIYKHLNIGTAKLDESEMQGVAHHMIDIIEPDTAYSVAEYKTSALKCAQEIISRGKTPIFSGGTGLYANAILFDYNFGTEKVSISSLSKPAINARVTVLERDRKVLYDRINKRVEDMFKKGLETEVRTLLKDGYGFDAPGMKAIGYKEFKPYFDGVQTLDETKEIIKKHSRNYAKRQITWFRSWKFAEILNLE